MELRAIQPVYRGGRLIQPGEPFTTTSEDGKSLIQEGKAREPHVKKPSAKPAKADPTEEK
ncbi:TPA: hypothetical protein L6A17_22205 [Pseudomonas aeruginosa]|uniref:hypothetical protein n=1 Tax=Pseudomonas aeruginosa TaxID=287 RepID=UPI000F539C76|nr:hypothetical protein [Pseudomonas aeruginosa]EIU7214146.1 hypothetical protein [Pseudomonas aeruginosa]EKQ6321961.1 hypothetical protein [Pseudomonas aeruginosa]EKQ7203152.1 hypothetical protein [Pseudomonas aeruginosa]ELO0918195.1 hypothetical protein [Pseudomonas aeruginosa]MBG5398257.1 hypothetical protein [Pseudomonas aeruginosa]